MTLSSAVVVGSGSTNTSCQVTGASPTRVSNCQLRIQRTENQWKCCRPHAEDGPVDCSMTINSASLTSSQNSTVTHNRETSLGFSNCVTVFDNPKYRNQ